MTQVHKEQLNQVENAIPGRGGLDIEIFGMEGVPSEIVDKHNQEVTAKHFADERARQLASGNPTRGSGANAANKRAKKNETLEEIQERAEKYRDDRANGVLPLPVADVQLEPVSCVVLRPPDTLLTTDRLPQPSNPSLPRRAPLSSPLGSSHPAPAAFHNDPPLVVHLQAHSRRTADRPAQTSLPRSTISLRTHRNLPRPRRRRRRRARRTRTSSWSSTTRLSVLKRRWRRCRGTQSLRACETAGRFILQFLLRSVRVSLERLPQRIDTPWQVCASFVGFGADLSGAAACLGVDCRGLAAGVSWKRRVEEGLEDCGQRPTKRHRGTTVQDISRKWA